MVLAWIGFGKYVKMEARVLIEHSPLMSWIYDYLSVTAVARGLGTMEIVAALLIALRPVWPRASTVGSALAVVLFMGTLSFLFTTPGVVATHAAGVPVLTAQPGQFLLKDSCSSVWRCGIWVTRFEVRCGSALSTSPTDQCVNCIGVEVVAIGGRQSECAHDSWLLFMLRTIREP